MREEGRWRSEGRGKVEERGKVMQTGCGGLELRHEPVLMVFRAA